MNIECHTDELPNLARVLSTGEAYISDGDIVGIAADGTRVSLGVTHDPLACEAYLTAFPTPAEW